MLSSLQDTALVIVGHGSTLNPDSSTPTHRCADEIRRRGIFYEVVCAFWKEEPSMREVFHMLRSRRVFIVPNFISEGYFTRQVLPRELRLEGAVTVRDGMTLVYCDPVGIHSSMTKLLLHRADEVTLSVPRAETSLVIAGHGTSLNENSRKAIEHQVALIRAGGHGFAEVLDAYMEEAPHLAKWDEIASAPNVVVVPFFIADGLHSYQDIPVLLGMNSELGAAASQSEVFRQNPHSLRGRKLFYSRAVGTDDLMTDVILDQVKDSLQAHAAQLAVTTEKVATQAAMPHESFVIGQIRATPIDAGGWELCHVEDEALTSDHPSYQDAASARDIAMYDDAGNFRALKSAPNLRHGWCLRVSDEAALRLALDFFYPAALGLWQCFQNKTLTPVHLRETLGRQTGMYRFANTIGDDTAQHLIAYECAARTKCLRRILWNLDDTRRLTEIHDDKRMPANISSQTIPLLCVEACTHIVSAAREAARIDYKTKDAVNS